MVQNDSVSLGHGLWTRDNKEHAYMPHTFRRFSLTASGFAMASGLGTTKNMHVYGYPMYGTFRRFSMTASALAMASGLETIKNKSASIPSDSFSLIHS